MKNFLEIFMRRNPGKPSTGFMGLHTITHDGLDYMTRIWFWRFRLHIFHRGDHDHDCHDHPWDFWTFPLTSYVEDVLNEVRETTPIPNPKSKLKRFYKSRHIVSAFRLHRRKAEHAHRVLGAWNGISGSSRQTMNMMGVEDVIVPGKKIITFVYQGGPRRKWGFFKLRDGRWCWQDWKGYVLEGGRDAPCS